MFHEGSGLLKVLETANVIVPLACQICEEAFPCGTELWSNFVGDACVWFAVSENVFFAD